MKAIYRPSVLRIAEISTRAMLALVICMIGLLAAPQTVQTARAASFDCNSVTDVPPSECEALVALYNSTNGAAWSTSTNWLSTTTVDDWYGVWVLNGHVDKLQLWWNNLTGTIPTQIVNLTNLVDLSINNNAITGTLPDELGSLTKLEILNLNNNQFQGSIPSTLGNLQYLRYLILQSNRLTGSIPPELGNLTNLTSLYLMGNGLSGSIPPELGNLANLIYLRLSHNNLSGSIPPQLSQLANLHSLYLDENSLSGTIPPELGIMTSLWGLYLSDNLLTGSIPVELGNMTSLLYLELADNQLDGSIPSELGNLSDLITFRIYNNPVTGFLPSSLGNLPNLDQLWLDNTALSGSFPLSFTSNTSMFYVSFEDTLICEPDRPEFDAWKSTVTSYYGTGNACVSNPLPDEKLTSSKVTFAWDPVTDAAMYKLQLSTKEDFSSTVFSVKVPESTYPYLTSLLFNKTYYWRVRALVNDVWEDWVSYKFYSMDPLAAPVLADPGDGALLYPNITLSWDAVTNAVQYKLQVATDSAFTDRVFNGKLTDTFKDFNDLAPGKYYWRVKAIEEGGLKSPWSEVRGFTVTKIFPPTLASPDNQATVGPDVTLSWNSVVGAAQYKLQVSKDAAFTKLIVNEKTTALSKDLTALAARNYYWRVKAIDADGFKSPWSEVRIFMVSDTP